MTGAEVQAVYFSPLMFFFYLFTVLVLMILYYQWAWTKKCRTQVKLLVIMSDGSTETVYAPKDGNVAKITNPESGITKAWPLNKLCVAEENYPGDGGFVPLMLQKKIKTLMVDEEDWEPLLNRGTYSENVASPDVIAWVKKIAEIEGLKPEAKTLIEAFANNLTTASTREMIASPEFFGAAMQSSAMKALSNVSDALTDAIKNVTLQLARIKGLNPTYVYIGLGLNLVLSAFFIIKVLPALENIDAAFKGIEAIAQSLGVAIP